MILTAVPGHASQRGGGVSSPAAIGLAGGMAGGVPERRRATTALLKERPLRLYYYVDDAPSFRSLETHAELVGVLAPQAFWIDSQGSIHGHIQPRVEQLARQAGIPLVPLLFNRRFDRSTVSAMLESPVAQERAANALVRIAREAHAAGFQIDFENIDPADRDLYTRFIQLASRRLDAAGFLLSVALVPRLTPFAGGSVDEAPPGQWAAAFDYPALGAAADFVTLMTYDNYGRSDPPGPVAGIRWVKRTLDYATVRIPSEKILIGIPLYGREWIQEGSGYATRALAYPDVAGLLSRFAVRAQWDEHAQSPWFRFAEGRSVATVYFENRQSLDEKLRLIAQYHLKGFAAWRLGSEDPAFWTLAALGRDQAALTDCVRRDRDPRRGDRAAELRVLAQPVMPAGRDRNTCKGRGRTGQGRLDK